MEEEEEDYNDQMMEVQPDVVIHDDLNDPDEVEPDEQPDDNGEYTAKIYIQTTVVDDWESSKTLFM